MPPPGTRIRRLRARLPRQETLTARRTLERLLVTCDPSENLLPPGALLCIRQMRDPLPGALALTPQSLQPPRRWRDALDTRWQEFLTHASRPFHDPIAASASAPAVLFADESELLACLARSAVDGRLRTEWWWTSLLQPDELPDWLRRWQRRPQILPTALHRLAEDGALSRVLRSLSEDRAGTLLQTLRRSHGLLHLPETVPGAIPTTDPAEATSATPIQSTPAHRSDPASRAHPPAFDTGEPAWARLLPELIDPTIPRSARACAAVGLLLIRAPQIPRHPDFTGTLLHWLDIEAIPSRAPSADQHLEDVDLVRQPGPDSSRPTLNTPLIESGPYRSAEASASEATPPSAGQPVLPGEPPLPTAVPAADPGPTPTTAHPVGPPAAPEWILPMAARRESHLTESEGVPRSPESTAFSTEFGGVFFLLNVALSLGLYADFTEPLTPGLDLSPWDLLDLLAIRGADSSYLEDPLRLHLAAWSGRSPDALPGAHFQPPTESASPIPATPRSRGRQAALTSPGTPSAPRSHDPGPSNGASFPPRLPTPSPTDPGLRVHRSPEMEPPHLSRWLDHLVESIESRLHRALPSWETGPRLPRLVQQRARVESFDTTLQIRFALESHPIAIRLAGLDRDPGWIPAAGRTVLFVFETGATAAPVRRP